VSGKQLKEVIYNLFHFIHRRRTPPFTNRNSAGKRHMSPRDIKLLRNQAFIGGRWVDGSDRRRFDVADPANGSVLASVADCTRQDAETAVMAADAAFSSWKEMPGKVRAHLLRRWFDLITLHTEELGVLLAREEGKPLAEAKAEIIYAASFVEWFCRGSAARLWRNHPAVGHEILILKQPIGVTTAITPWNFPSAMITRKIAPALAAGCTSVVKPAEETPMPALALGAGGGIPDGVINILPSTRAHEIGPLS
jgi:succinate-semialdehyde dehydrogenase / glutarate-semialdehyde dehydrogenase